MKRVLVTGATGFSGTYLCGALASKGYRVLGTFLKRPRQDPDSYPILELDLKSYGDVLRVIRDFRPHFLVHLAAQSNSRRSWDLQDETFAVNVGGTLNLLNAVKQTGGQTRFLLASSVQVYGQIFHQPGPVREDGPVAPENPYAFSKRVAELACLDFFTRFGLDVVIARMANHAGPGQEPSYVFSDWSRQIALAEKSGRPALLRVGNLNVERDFLHVEDAVSAYAVLLMKGKAGEIYNVASAKPEKLKRYADFLARTAAINVRILNTKNRIRSSEPKKTWIKTSKIKALGWKPRKTAIEALRELLDDWRRRVSHG